MANNVIIPAQGTGDTTPKVSTDQVTADQSQVQNVQLASVAGGVLTRNPTIPISAASLPLPTGAALESTQVANGVLLGGVTETAPGTDTASSGLNGRLQRIAQRLTSLIALLPASLGQKTMANGFAVTIASDQSAVPVSGTVTITPSGTQTVSNAGTFAVQDSQVITDNAAFTDGTSKVFATGYVFDEVAGTALTENDAAAARVDSKRAQVQVIEDATTRGQRQAVSAAGAASSNLTQVAGATVAQGHGTAATALRVELPTDGTGTVVLAAGAAAIGTVDTELPAAAALGDSDANPTAPKVGSALQGWTGSVWARLRTSLGDATASAAGILNTAPMLFNSGTSQYDRQYGTAANGAAVDVTRLQNPVQAATATLANKAASATSITLQASNSARKGLVIVNDSTSILYVKFGATASTTSYTYFLAGSVGGVPATLELPIVTYTGIVDGIWASATGNARVTELT